MRPLPRRTLIVTVVIAATAALLIIGSLLYWVADGRPRTPEAFRELVAETGLIVDWSNNGPRGGDGVVATECGDQTVSVNELDGELWVHWGNDRSPLTPSLIDDIVQCDPAVRQP